MSLWLCLRFSQLPLQCQTLVEEQPVVVLAKQRVLRGNDCAASLGVREGMSAATVRALAGSGPLQLLQRDQAAEQRCLQQLCCWAYGITPTLHPWREDCLQLEIGGSLALFRGLDALLEEVHHGLNYRGYRVQTGLAATPRGAWLLSFAEQEHATLVEGDLAERLAQLPLTLLDEFPQEIANLNSAGLHTFSDILALPEAALGRRCGKNFVRCLRQILGREADLQPNYKPPTRFSDQYWFGYEVKANTELLPAVQYLLQSLCQFLRHTQLQTGEIEWQLVGVDRQQHRLQVRSSTRHSDWSNWYRLARLQFERLQLRTGVESIILECNQLASGHGASIDLFSPHNQREPLQALLDRLRGRLGLQAIRKIGCRDEHLPEFALHVGSDDLPQPTAAHSDCGQRPFWLMPEPRHLEQRSGRLYWNGALQLVRGPERIEDNWWQTPVSRDYYVAQGPAGQHYWVFHDRLNRQWYIHGLFA
ncbi:aspartate decarboxylase [Kineobactrum sediminis]|uniref:Aspartate decarboxylase n=1 Tax=Kineobactrum sediminis TaxID=1905677 RepID=A0A2N5Y610_9GAMM|nr:DNA polymerase Y family protein [Kineobactrum sediminis]PLW83828.1 aspartate decarboxylase [Kineobactrum sediminis]